MFNPGAAGEGNGIISVIGSGIFKCFKTAENSLKLLTSALAKREPQNYMAHCWLSEGERERMVLGTDSGELLIIEGTELKATLQLDPGSTVVSIAAYSKVGVLPHLCHCCIFSLLFHALWQSCSQWRCFCMGIPLHLVPASLRAGGLTLLHHLLQATPPYLVICKMVTHVVTCFDLCACDKHGILTVSHAF